MTGTRNAPELPADHCLHQGVHLRPAAQLLPGVQRRPKIETPQTCLQIIAFVREFILGQQLHRCQEFSRGRELKTLQSCLPIVAFVKDFLVGQQPNRCQEFNGGQELEALQSCRHIIVFVREFTLGPQLNRCQELG